MLFDHLHTQCWQSIEEVLSFFGSRFSASRRAYRNFLGEGIDQTENPVLSGGGLIRSYGGWETIAHLRKEHSCCIGDERILGDSKFVENVLAQDELAIKKKSLYLQQEWNLNKLIEKVCELCNIDVHQLSGKARANKLAQAKSLICYWGTRELELPLREIAERLRISQPAVSIWVKKGAELCEKENFKFQALAA